MPDMTRLSVAGWAQVLRFTAGPAVAFIAFHRVFGGRAFGGIRILEYSSEAAALQDAMDLSRAMSFKVAMAGIRGGGAKAVLMRPTSGREEAVRALAEAIEGLEGRYLCGADLGFTAADDAILRRHTRHVACGDLSGDAARGVLLAMTALPRPRSVAVQGLGAVGRKVAEALAADGVRVIASDPRGTGGFETMEPERIHQAECDVFSPCAVGGLIDETVARELRCTAVCGAANNPLAGDGDSVADILHRRGIQYIPDFVANAGATIAGASRALGEADRIEARMAAIPGTVREILARSRAEDRSPHQVARDMAIQRLRDLELQE